MKNATYNTAKKTVAYAIAAFSFFALCACSADSSIASPDTDYSVTSINNNDFEKSVVPVNNRPALPEGLGSKWGTVTDVRDGKTYKTVRIGAQTWMAENMNYETRLGSYCYENSADSCAKYGRLYTWTAAIGSIDNECGVRRDCSYLENAKVRGVCPLGWRVPTLDDWNTLIHYVGGIDVAGKMLKSYGDWNGDGSKSVKNPDGYGFSARPSGYKADGIDYYAGASFGTDFWTTAQATGLLNNAMAIYISHRSNKIFGIRDHKDTGNPVRCVKD